MPQMRVLIADDHPVFRRTLRAFLEAAGDIDVVAEAADGDEALAGVAASGRDVAILDLDMPRRDGLEVACALRAARAPVKVVFLTAHRTKALVARARNAGACGYVLKDAWAAEILDCVRKVFADGRTAGP